MSGRLLAEEAIADFFWSTIPQSDPAGAAKGFVQWLTDAGFAIVAAPGRFERHCPSCGAAEVNWDAAEV